jgi:hypothetical protein
MIADPIVRWNYVNYTSQGAMVLEINYQIRLELGANNQLERTQSCLLRTAMIYSELWEELADNIPAASLVVISFAPEASVDFIGSSRAAHAASHISCGKYLAFMKTIPDRLCRAVYLHPVLRYDRVGSSEPNVVLLGQETEHIRSLKSSWPWPWSVPCAVDGSTFYKFEPNSFDKPSNLSQTYHFDPDLWDTYSHAIRKESRCRAVQEMQDEMDKYDIPLDDRYEWDIARSLSGPSTLPPPGRYSRVPPIKVDISLDFDAINDIPDHREFEKELREIHRYAYHCTC